MQWLEPDYGPYTGRDKYKLWHQHFAWIPVKISETEQVVWLETVERRLVIKVDSDGCRYDDWRHRHIGSQNECRQPFEFD